MKNVFFLLLLLLFIGSGFSPRAEDGSWKLVWSDEFDKDGIPNPDKWGYETGFVRNEELQWYLPQNAFCRSGLLIVEAKKERVANPGYSLSATGWREKRKEAEVTSASLTTDKKFSFRYGRVEVKARIPVSPGSWPAIWTLGQNVEWPSCGEIDIMEFYRIRGVPHLLANVAWGNDRKHDAVWRSQTKPLSYFLAKDSLWTSKFHVWRMDWDESSIRLYLDGELMNKVDLKETVNGSIGNFKNPFKEPQYLIINLAVGGVNGGLPDYGCFPLRYEVDYVRVYQKDALNGK